MDKPNFWDIFIGLISGAHPLVYAGVVIKYMPPVMPRYIGGAV
jgi:hypothetical protein